MGARLRLNASVDVNQRTADPNARKIFRAMQKHGLIVADNGSDMYITGTYDTRWDNGILNPAFAALTASDFEVIQLGYNAPSSQTATALRAVSVSPSSVTGGQTANGTVILTAAAPAEGIVVDLSTGDAAVTLPATVTVAAGSTSANFTLNTSPVGTTTTATITASYNGVNQNTALAVKPPVLSSLALNPTTVVGGSSSTGTIVLSGAAPFGGTAVALSSSRSGRAKVPSTVTVAAGNNSATFTVDTTAGAKVSATISASYSGVTKKATLTILRRSP
jgi:hypothetical protein